jgi:hypothetical protein
MRGIHFSLLRGGVSDFNGIRRTGPRIGISLYRLGQRRTRCFGVGCRAAILFGNAILFPTGDSKRHSVLLFACCFLLVGALAHDYRTPWLTF